MKNLFKKLILVSFLATLIIGCGKEESTIQNGTDVESVNNVSNDKEKTQKAITAGVTATCTGGGCTDGGACKMTLSTSPYYIECCAGCSMTITAIAGYAYDASLEDYLEYIPENLNDYFTGNYGASYDVVINNTDIYKPASGDVYIFVDYTENSTGDQSSVSFILEFDDQAELSKKQQIDCSGSCNEPSESCRERYYPSTGGVECTCEGSCNMVVTELPNVAPGPVNE